MASGRFRQPPRLRTIESGEDDRRATWLELFFDLVFVAAVAELSLNLIDDPSLGGLLGYLGLFVPVWWAWMGFTFYANRFDSDDLAYRLLTLAGMFAVAALATTVHGALDDGQLGFTIAYVSIRCALLFLYGRAIVHVEVGRRLAAWYFTVFGFAVLIWTASLLFGGPLRYWLWALALALEIGAPVVGWRLIPQAPPIRDTSRSASVCSRSSCSGSRFLPSSSVLQESAGRRRPHSPPSGALSSPRRCGGSTSTFSTRPSSVAAS
ncbi:MAG: low temperature requirement protein A [Actinobacteria bacterium]|nr:low temperature requirement protein A [Actinomycetota bacterium]